MLIGMLKGLSMGFSLGLPKKAPLTLCNVRLHNENYTFEAGYALLNWSLCSFTMVYACDI